MNLMMLLEMAHSGFGDRVALVSGGERLTFTELFERAGAVAGLLRDSGAAHAALLDVSSPALPLLLFGSAWAGIPFAPLNYRLSGDELQALLARIEPSYLVDEAGLSGRFAIDSAGTGSWHVGERPDARATLVAEHHGVTLECRARQVTAEDLSRFDYVIAMDRENLQTLRRMADAGGSEARVQLLRDYDPLGEGEDVPDPYYGGASGFETVYEMVYRSCEGLLRTLAPA